MKCKECENLNQKSKVFSDGIFKTLLASNLFYDEDGKFHSHDPNTIQQDYHCSNDHYFTKSLPIPCWCGWPGLSAK